MVADSTREWRSWNLATWGGGATTLSSALVVANVRHQGREQRRSGLGLHRHRMGSVLGLGVPDLQWSS